MSAGVRIELSIEWPSLLDGRVPLQVVTVGRVVRCEHVNFFKRGGAGAVSVSDHEEDGPSDSLGGRGLLTGLECLPAPSHEFHG